MCLIVLKYMYNIQDSILTHPQEIIVLKIKISIRNGKQFIISYHLVPLKKKSSVFHDSFGPINFMLHSVPSIKINTSFFSFCIPSHEFFFKSIIFSCYILSVKNKQGQFGKKINKKTTFIK